MSKRLSRSHREQGIEDIAESLNLAKSSINLYFSRVNPEFDLIFIHQSEDEINSERNKQLYDIEVSYLLNLMSAIEAKFKIDYAIRCEQKKKDELSRTFREKYKNNGLKVKFDEDILKSWRPFVSDTSIVNELFTIVKYRNWLAHGRFWLLKTNVERFDFDYVYSIADYIQNHWPLMD